MRVLVEGEEGDGRFHLGNEGAGNWFHGGPSSAAPMEEVVVLGGAGSGASRGSRPLFMGARQREEGDLSAVVLGEGNAAGEGATAWRPGAAMASAVCPPAERRRCVASARRCSG